MTVIFAVASIPWLYPFRWHLPLSMWRDEWLMDDLWLERKPVATDAASTPRKDA